MAETVVRSATLDDVDDVLSMYEWLFAPPGSRPALWDPARATAAIRHAVSSEAAVVLVAALGDELGGFCSAYDELE
jgi:hypothetical protein